jgi:hypothetical protein
MRERQHETARASSVPVVKRARTGQDDAIARHRTPTPVTEGRMNGFVRLWRSTDERGSGATWQPAYALMDENSLRFYATDTDALSGHGRPLQTIDLSQQKWRMRFQPEPDDAYALRQDDKPFLVEMKITPE